jgi:hypothetical protein
VTTATPNTVEQRVHDRIAADRAGLDRDLADVRAQRTAARTEYDGLLDRTRELSAEVIALDDAGQSVPQDKQDALNAAHRDAMRVMARMIGLGERVQRVVERLEHVGSEADVAERIETAERLAALPDRTRGTRGSKGPSMRAAAITVLLNAGAPQHFREITRLAIDSGLLRTTGATPAQTMSAMLATDAKSATPMFERVASGVYGLCDEAKARDEVGMPVPEPEPVEPPRPAEPLDFACPTCASAAGAYCTKPRGGGRTGRQNMTAVHATRRDLAKEAAPA